MKGKEGMMMIGRGRGGGRSETGGFLIAGTSEGGETNCKFRVQQEADRMIGIRSKYIQYIWPVTDTDQEQGANDPAQDRELSSEGEDIQTHNFRVGPFIPYPPPAVE